MKLLTISVMVRLGFFLFDVLFLYQTTMTCACRFIDGETWRLLFFSCQIFCLISPPAYHECAHHYSDGRLDSFWSDLLFNIPATPQSYHDVLAITVMCLT